jgi:hypothetical protein
MCSLHLVKVQVKLILCSIKYQTMKMNERGRIEPHAFLTSALDGGPHYPLGRRLGDPHPV